MDPNAEREFTRFVEERTHALFRVAYALTGEQHAAEDLLQGALARAATHWSRIRGDAEPYVKRIIYHHHISIWRRRRRHQELLTAAPPEHAGARDVADDAVLRVQLRSALGLLPPRQRAVLVLRYLEDLSEREVAEVLGCQPGTVASQASRALAKLRQLTRVPGPPTPPRRNHELTSVVEVPR